MLFFFPCVRAGERRRKAVCVRQSDHLEVSDQRCERLPRPVALAEPCNTDCEIRFASALSSTISVRHADATLANC